jgi:hypothetical protein
MNRLSYGKSLKSMTCQKQIDADGRAMMAAAPRELRVPASSISVDSGNMPRDGVYTINLKVGPQGRSAVCTTDENSAVLGVVYKRPE